MKSVNKQILLPYSAQNMYDLVNNVEKYPQFLPWCSKVEVFIKTTEIIDAKLHIDFKGIKQFFHTNNINKIGTDNSSIEMKFVDGPFKYFSGQWLFKKIGDNACKVCFNLDYEFSSKILENIIGPVFKIITNTFVDCFVNRAKIIYSNNISTLENI